MGLPVSGYPSLPNSTSVMKRRGPRSVAISMSVSLTPEDTGGIRSAGFSAVIRWINLPLSMADFADAIRFKHQMMTVGIGREHRYNERVR